MGSIQQIQLDKVDLDDQHAEVEGKLAEQIRQYAGSVVEEIFSRVGTAEGTLIALKDEGNLDAEVELLRRERERLAAELAELEGPPMVPGASNLIRGLREQLEEADKVLVATEAVAAEWRLREHEILMLKDAGDYEEAMLLKRDQRFLLADRDKTPKQIAAEHQKWGLLVVQDAIRSVVAVRTGLERAEQLARDKQLRETKMIADAMMADLFENIVAPWRASHKIVATATKKIIVFFEGRNLGVRWAIDTVLGDMWRQINHDMAVGLCGRIVEDDILGAGVDAHIEEEVAKKILREQMRNQKGATDAIQEVMKSIVSVRFPKELARRVLNDVLRKIIPKVVGDIERVGRKFG